MIYVLHHCLSIIVNLILFPEYSLRNYLCGFMCKKAMSDLGRIMDLEVELVRLELTK